MASERENTLCNAQCICFKCELLTNSSVPFASLWWSFQWHFSSPGFLPQFSSLLLLKVDPLLLLAHCTPPGWCHMNNYRPISQWHMNDRCHMRNNIITTIDTTTVQGTGRCQHPKFQPFSIWIKMSHVQYPMFWYLRDLQCNISG